MVLGLCIIACKTKDTTVVVARIKKIERAYHGLKKKTMYAVWWILCGVVQTVGQDKINYGTQLVQRFIN